MKRYIYYDIHKNISWEVDKKGFFALKYCKSLGSLWTIKTLLFCIEIKKLLAIPLGLYYPFY